MKECKRCLLREAAEEDVFRAVETGIARIPEKDRADAELYERRLAVCRSCDHLLSGVCQKCGCYVELRAAFKRSKCPDAAGKRWGFRGD